MLYQSANPHGGDGYSHGINLDFSTNINPLSTPVAVRLAVHRELQHLDRYPDPYCKELVTAIAAFEQLPKDFILCGNGAAELIFSYCAACEPKLALEMAPTFSEYALALDAVGCQTERHVLLEQDSFAVTSTVLQKLTEKAWDVCFLCNPNNPTGQLIEPELLTEIIRVCDSRNIRVFLDECFLDLTGHELTHTAKPWLTQSKNLFILKAFTKSFGMAGLRLGYGLSSDAELLLAMSKTVQPWNVSVLAQAAGVAALTDPDYLLQAKQIIAIERTRMRERLAALGLKVYPSDANYLLLYSSAPLKELLLQHSIQIRDCSNYHGLTSGFFRIAIKTHDENNILLNTIQTVLQEKNVTV